MSKVVRTPRVNFFRHDSARGALAGRRWCFLRRNSLTSCARKQDNRAYTPLRCRDSGQRADEVDAQPIARSASSRMERRVVLPRNVPVQMA